MPATEVTIKYDLQNALEVVSGYSKKGKPFEVLGIKQSERWNSFVIAIAKQQGVAVRQVNMPKDTE